MELLTGRTGFIGRNYYDSSGPILTPTHKDLDLTDREAVKRFLKYHNPTKIIHCASNDSDVCLYDNLRMFYNLSESKIPMITFCTGREIEDRAYKNGEYVLSKRIIKELSLKKYNHITVIQLWGCFGKYEKDIRFFATNLKRLKEGLTPVVKEDKMFSYVYVNDVVKIIKDIVPGEGQRLLRLVAYTKFLSEYAKHFGREVFVESEKFSSSYVGINNFQFEYTPLEQAIKEIS